jgi:hypothetical protein
MAQRILFFTFFIFFTANLVAATTKETITGVYSNMVYNSEGGDILGIEISIVRVQGGYAVVFQDAEGGPKLPVVVPAIVRNEIISFELPERDGYAGKFVGKIKGGKFYGKFPDGSVGADNKPDFTLQRGVSYWQKTLKQDLCPSSPLSPHK